MLMNKGRKNNMTNNVLAKIDECIEHPEKISPNSIEGLVSELLTFFEKLKENVMSPNEEDRSKAIAEAMTLKEDLEARAASLFNSINIDSATLESYLNNSTVFSSDEWNTMLKAKEELETYRKEIEEKTTTSTPKKNKSRKTKILTQV